MENDKEQIRVEITKNPRTVIVFNKNLSENQIKQRIEKYLNKKGHLKIDTVPGYEIYN